MTDQPDQPDQPDQEHDASYWDDRYRTQGGDKHQHTRSAGPDPAVVDVVAGLAPGRALDLACGQGRHAIYLAGLGWAVTAVDFSPVAVARGAADEPPGGQPIEWVVADAARWAEAQDTAYDLVLCSFFHLAVDAYPSVRHLLAPGGRLVIIGHAVRNLTDGTGGPSNPAYLHTEDQLRATATGLTIERLDEVTRQTGHGPQIDLVLVARRA